MILDDADEFHRGCFCRDQKPVDHVPDTQAPEYEGSYFRRQTTAQSVVPRSLVNIPEATLTDAIQKGSLMLSPPHVPRPRWFDEQVEHMETYRARYGSAAPAANTPGIEDDPASDAGPAMPFTIGVPVKWIYRHHVDAYGEPTGLPIQMADIRDKKVMKSE